MQNLNDNPALPFTDDQFDIAIITVSIQYVTRPITLFREIRRVLKPGAALVIIFSNRLFPTKAVRVWYEQDDEGHVALVQVYFELAGGYDEATFIDRSAPQQIDTRGRLLPTRDPVFVVLAHKIT